MPCNSDYLAPHFDEIESQKAAQNILYIASVTGKKVDEWIAKSASDIYGNTKRIDELFSRLCHACASMSEDEKSRIIYNGRDSKARQLADWWDKHQAADRARIESEMGREVSI